MEHISKLSAIRSNLFKDLKSEYDEQLKKKLGAGDSLSNQNAVLNNTEKQLNNLKRNLSKAEQIRDNRKRMIEIGDYEFSRYEEHKKLMKILAYTSFGIMISVYLLKKELVPPQIAKGGIVGSGVLGLIYIITQLIDMWYRDNMDYNKYDFGFWYEPGLPESKKGAAYPESRWQINKRGFNKLFWGHGGTPVKNNKDLAEINNQQDDSPSMSYKGESNDTYEEQLQKLFNQNNCPEGAFIRGYCNKKKNPAKNAANASEEGSTPQGEEGLGEKNPESLGAAEEKLPKQKEEEVRSSLVGNSSAWKNLDFDEEGFHLMGTAAGAGPNFFGAIKPFTGF